MRCRFSRSRRHVCLFFVAMAPVTTGDARAQESEELPPVVVSATTTERKLRDAPATISVVTRDQLSRRPVQDLSDALRGTPGITISGIGLNRRGISIRGMPSEHTLILVDGKRINTAGSAIAHADYDLNWIPVEAIERIEVVRGPMSSLYGSEALGGVVNVITRRATDAWHGSFSGTGGLQQRRGGDTYQFGGYAGGPLVPGRLALSLYGEASGRQLAPDPTEPRRSELEKRDSASGKAVLTWTPDTAQRIDLGYGYGVDRRTYKLQSEGSVQSFYKSTDEVERQQFSFAHQGDWGWGSSTLRAYRSTLYRENRRSQGTPSGPHRLTDDVVDGHLTFGLLGWNRITLGGEWREERLKDSTVNRRGRAQATHNALFLQDEITLGSDWSLVVGNRLDHHDAFGWQNSPRAYLVHHWNDALTLRAGIGRGFKAPTLKQLSPEYSAIAAAGRFTIVGNPDLRPEINTSYELSADYQAATWSLRATVFQNDLKNLIQTVCVRFCGIRGREVRTYQNIEKARIRGVELTGGISLPWQLRLDANYTFLDTKNRTTGQELPERPRHGGNVTLGWTPREDTAVQLRGDYVGRQIVYPTATGGRRLPGYTLWSIDLSHRLTDAVTVRGGVQNIANERLAEKSSLFTYAEPGRLYWVGLNYRF